MYIGHIQPTDTVGRVALTGVGVCLPLIMIITAFSYLIGMGAAPRGPPSFWERAIRNRRKKRWAIP